MEHQKRVRIVKRERGNEAAAPVDSRPATATAAAAREAKDVVSGWVREHQRRSEEFRNNYSTLLGQLGLTAPWAARAAGPPAPAFSAGE